jgi:hypothetical protein
MVIRRGPALLEDPETSICGSFLLVHPDRDPQILPAWLLSFWELSRETGDGSQYGTTPT